MPNTGRQKKASSHSASCRPHITPVHTYTTCYTDAYDRVEHGRERSTDSGSCNAGYPRSLCDGTGLLGKNNRYTWNHQAQNGHFPHENNMRSQQCMSSWHSWCGRLLSASWLRKPRPVRNERSIIRDDKIVNKTILMCYYFLHMQFCSKLGTNSRIRVRNLPPARHQICEPHVRIVLILDPLLGLHILDQIASKHVLAFVCVVKIHLE
jgi:hypothetical protein